VISLTSFNPRRGNAPVFRAGMMSSKRLFYHLDYQETFAFNGDFFTTKAAANNLIQPVC
jgi:hypothetical protein